MIRTSLLILDDNASFAESLADVLSQQGFHVRWAAQTAKAHALAKASPPDVLIVDINLVTASGMDVAEQFAREDLVGGVVFLTGSVDIDHRQIPEALRNRAVVLHKPVAKEMLLNAITSVADDRELRKSAD